MGVYSTSTNLGAGKLTIVSCLCWFARNSVHAVRSLHAPLRQCTLAFISREQARLVHNCRMCTNGTGSVLPLQDIIYLHMNDDKDIWRAVQCSNES